MSAWPQTYDGYQSADTTIVTTAETVVLTVSGVTVPGAGARVKLAGTAFVTTGTGVTAITPRWRRGTDATGTLVGEGDPIAAAASTNATTTLQVTDTPPDSAGLTYVLTVQQTGATGNGNITQAGGTATV